MAMRTPPIARRTAAAILKFVVMLIPCRMLFAHGRDAQRQIVAGA
jgi:hypothetical protein